MSLTSLHQVLQWISEGKIKELENFFNDSAQLKVTGVSIDVSNLKQPLVLINKVEEIHRGGIGGTAVNGGIISMLVDLAVGLLGLPYYYEGLTATQHLSIHFVKPLHATSVRVEATEEQVINNRVFGYVKVMNEKGETCAYASGVLVKGIKK